MGIELELHAERPGRRKKGAPDTPLRASYKHGEGLASALSGLDLHHSGVLGRVDPYRDTAINEQEAELAGRQIVALIERCPTGPERAALLDLAAMLEACATTPGSYLVFIGD
ncbi:hypothetical protein ACIQF6_23285 [Kitasatospora sp. NPDC092948]|uniref:hypothetical protein n=1 Tax=Kitasatospora sp. NPDC092948 TaxID=3364088 RepID=UPI0038166C4C